MITLGGKRLGKSVKVVCGVILLVVLAGCGQSSGSSSGDDSSSSESVEELQAKVTELEEDVAKLKESLEDGGGPDRLPVIGREFVRVDRISDWRADSLGIDVPRLRPKATW